MNFTVRMDEDIYHTTNLTKESNRSSVQPFIEDYVVLTEGKRICSDPYHVFINVSYTAKIINIFVPLSFRLITIIHVVEF